MTDYDLRAHIKETVAQLSEAAHELARICELEASGIRDGDGAWDPPEMGTHGHAEDVLGDAMAYVTRLIERIERAKAVDKEIAEANEAKAVEAASRFPRVVATWAGPT